MVMFLSPCQVFIFFIFCSLTYLIAVIFASLKASGLPNAGKSKSASQASKRKSTSIGLKRFCLWSDCRAYDDFDVGDWDAKNFSTLSESDNSFV
ncbi:hypothetical protein THIOM_004731 [Candidatus Thiomargarita nelsonii]|uniref:Uncharacterized protein n=1 Tax=Candidatus Thiomargarita nelsonii TaxID=1003181 RepID=A0A176RV45_9GAMM|nr:hypothetical protein THIOM_004731 [Candidatus Thiomargarita nelsonii]